MKRTRLLAAVLATLLLAGCGQTGIAGPAGSGAGPADQSAPPTDPKPSVQVDWSRLEEKAAIQPDLDGGRWYPEYVAHLPAGEDYGPLLSYVGAMVKGFYTWTDDNGQERTQAGWPAPMYGLMTRAGVVVTDAVYQYVERATYRKEGKDLALPVLVLGQARGEWGDYNNGLRYAMAAEDGRWVTDFEFWNYTAREEEMMLYGPAGLTWMDVADGQRKDWSWESLGIYQEDLPQLTMEIQWLYGFNWLEEGIYLGHVGDAGDSPVRIFRPETGQLVQFTAGQWEEALNRYYDAVVARLSYWELQEDGETVTLSRGEESHTFVLPQEVDSLAYDVKGGLVDLSSYSDDGRIKRAWVLDLNTGKVLLEGREISLISQRTDFEALGAVQVWNADGTCTLYSPALEPILTVTPRDENSWIYVNARDELLSVWDDETFYSCCDMETGTYIFHRNLSLGD